MKLGTNAQNMVVILFLSEEGKKQTLSRTKFSFVGTLQNRLTNSFESGEKQRINSEV